ncbi:urease accessory UreF family protein [Paenibacillus sp. Marseille-Q4541]|uniref:urease accessory protein UreF n=1 Tax=Paenibacillus sp. Marseille-Q4541 TaxID=2831522 RepID=UPI001BA72C53|nr:urease accessory UreF family protein [Paenibacillus sp. Marseille-Q4541]
MNRGNKLLDYVKMLDSSLQVGGFSHSFGLKSQIEEGKIRTAQDIQTFMQLELHPSLVRIEGLAIKGIYSAVSQQDYWRIALIDKMIHVQRNPVNKRSSSRAMGKRLLKLSKALHPWMNFEPLEKALEQYDAVGSLPVVHAWINYQLEAPIHDAVSGYLHAAKDVCFIHVRRLLHLDPIELERLLSTLGEELDQEWNKIDLSDTSVFQRSLLSIQSLIPGFYLPEPGIKQSRA